MAKSKITEEQRTQICAMIGVGCSLRSAARLAGCCESSVRSLLFRDKAFSERFRKSEQTLEVIALRNVQTAAQKNWRAAAWLLEHVQPNEYLPIKRDVVTPEQVKLVVELYSETICREVRNHDDRRRVGKALADLTTRFYEHFYEKQRDRIDGIRRKPAKAESPA